MSHQQTRTTGTGSRLSTVSILLPCLMIGHFLWKLLIPAHEYPVRTVQILIMMIDCFMLIGLVGLKHSLPKPLFWIGLAAGIGLFVLRLTGDDGWWTGHLVNSLPPR